MPTTISSSSLPYDEYIMDDANEVGALATTVSLLESIRKNQPWFETPEESERLAQDDSNPDFHARCAARVRGVEKRIVEKASTKLGVVTFCDRGMFAQIFLHLRWFLRPLTTCANNQDADGCTY